MSTSTSPPKKFVLQSKTLRACGPPMMVLMIPPMIGGEVHQRSGSPVKTLKAVPYWGSMTSSPTISPPTLNDVPIGGHLSATAKTFPPPVLPSTTSMPSRQTHNKTPPSSSVCFTPVGYHTKEGRMVWVVYLRA